MFNPEEECVLCEAKCEPWIIVTLNAFMHNFNSKTFHAKLQLFQKKNHELYGSDSPVKRFQMLSDEIQITVFRVQKWSTSACSNDSR